MKITRLFFLLLISFIVHSEVIEIKNGEPVIFDPSETNITYNFTIPKDKDYKEALIFIKSNMSQLVLIEDGNEIVPSYQENYFYIHRLNSIKNKTLLFKHRNYYWKDFSKFILLDITKEINIEFDNFVNAVSSLPTSLLNYDPVYSLNFNIKEMNSDNKY